MNAPGPFSRVFAALARLVTRGRLVLVDDTTRPYQRLQVRGLAGEVFDDVQRIQPAGLATYPRPGAEVDLLEVGAARDHVVAVVVADDEERPTGLNAGDNVLHGDGYVGVRCASDGTITIEGPVGVRITISPSGDVTIDGVATGKLEAPAAELKGTTTAKLTGGVVTIAGSAITITGPVTLGGPVTLDSKVFLNHTHSGVTTGGGNTGTVV